MSSAILQDAFEVVPDDLASMRNSAERERIRQWMRSVMRANGWTANRWADIARTTATNITRFMANDDAPIPSYRTITKLAAVAPAPYDKGPHAAALTDILGAGDSGALPPLGNPVPEMIPIRSAGRGGVEQEMFLGTVGYTPRPSNLTGVREAYAIYMLGDSMEPKYEQGYLLHVNPVKPPSRGRDVVVFKTNNAVLIKRFIHQSDTEIVLEQLNPPVEIRIPLHEVREMGLVVGIDPEGG